MIGILFTIGNWSFGQQVYHTIIDGDNGYRFEVTLETTDLIIKGNGGGCNFNILFDYNIRVTKDGTPVSYGFWTLQGNFVDSYGTTFFDLPNNISDGVISGSGVTVGNQAINDLNVCANLSISNLDVPKVILQVQGPNVKGGFYDIDGVSPLPIQLKSFTAQSTDREITLTWTTATEQNNAFFTLERSNDGWNWESIGDVEGSGNSEREETYNLVDYSPLQGVNYYRLSQTDYDGRHRKFDPISINFDGTIKEIIVYPNPAKDRLYLLGIATPQVIVMRDVQGKIVKEWNLRNDTTEQITLDVSDLDKGIYILSTNIGEKKIVKQD